MNEDKIEEVLNEFKQNLLQRIEMAKFALSVADDAAHKIEQLLAIAKYSAEQVDDEQMQELLVLVEQSKALEDAMIWLLLNAKKKAKER